MKKNTNRHEGFSSFLLSSSKWLSLILITIVMAGSFSSCNSEKKMAINELEARLEKAKQELTAILDDDGTMDIETMEGKFGAIRAMNFDTPYVKRLQPKVKEVKGLMREVEKKIENEKQKVIEELNIRLLALINDDTKNVAELEKELQEIKTIANKYSNAETERLIKQLENKIAVLKEAAKGDKDLDSQFNDIVMLSKQGNIKGANEAIERTLTQFESPQTPVLIIISIEGTIIDYDKPTTIEAFLHYLKDQRINRNVVREVERNALGKIKVLELIKK